MEARAQAALFHELRARLNWPRRLLAASAPPCGDQGLTPTVRRPGVITYSSIVHRGFLMKARAQAALFYELRAWLNRPRRLLARCS
jgi:hypothetical protein